ncbi:MAG: UDP-N-acetylmuramoyl-L-alanine--D-glutamate ligase [Treponema sp.]|jgi:UDP-N-acetylmuramoylalanine--D-glutamate ligase|nr:UDP-N-acetylmuramoyl-L-alanine--D-glutamate ligase [Treponema sp.]
MCKEDFSGKKVLVMGLGLNGGGVESARFLASMGARVTVTDLQDEKALAPSIKKLEESIACGRKGPDFPVRYVLGRHNMEDFEDADLVVKNPGVKPDSPYLQKARRIETDISLFLSVSEARLIAVTGSKGKSTTVSALHYVLDKAHRAGLADSQNKSGGKAYVGGNITVSPLSFLDRLTKNDDVVLELSSWQLGDLLPGMNSERKTPLLKPRCAVITSIMPDHLDRYGSMEAYIADKRIIYKWQDKEDATIAENDDWGKSFLAESKGRPLVYSGSPVEGRFFPPGGWLSADDGPALGRLHSGEQPLELVPQKLLTLGRHQKKNLLAAALALLDLGIPPGFIRESLETFPGMEHRLEYFYENGGVRFYNDSAATIPEAAAAAVAAFDKPPILVTGGSDKGLDYGPLVKAAGKVKKLILLAGTGTDKLIPLFDSAGTAYLGPFNSVEKAALEAAREASPGDCVVLSPGCTSFEMFLNEFDRGTKWKEAVLGIKKA